MLLTRARVAGVAPPASSAARLARASASSLPSTGTSRSRSAPHGVGVVGGTTTSSSSASAHRLFKVSFNSCDPVVFCRRCGAYCSARLNDALKRSCSGSAGHSGRAVLARIDRGVHPSRTGTFKNCIVLGRPVPFSQVLASDVDVPHRSQSVAVRPLPVVHSLLERVRARASSENLETVE